MGGCPKCHIGTFYRGECIQCGYPQGGKLPPPIEAPPPIQRKVSAEMPESITGLLPREPSATENKREMTIHAEDLDPETREKLGITPVRTKGGDQHSRHRFLQTNRETIIQDYRNDPRAAQEQWKLSSGTRSRFGIKLRRGALTKCTIPKRCPCEELLKLRGYQEAVKDMQTKGGKMNASHELYH